MAAWLAAWIDPWRSGMGKRLDGRVALITGSTSGIGRATANLFASEGAKIIVNGRRRDWGEMVVQEITEAGGEAVYCEADLSVSQNVRDLVRFTISTYGRLDVLMNNAYANELGTAVELAEEDWDRSLAVMLKAPYIACQEAIPQMMQQEGGVIINTASVHGYLAAHRCFAYATAKAGLINMTKQLAVDFGPYGIRANAICPGAIRIERTEEHHRDNPNLARKSTVVYPLRRVGRPNDIAQAALYLASDAASFVSGTALVVDGGMTAQLQDTLYEGFEKYYRQSLAEEWGIERSP
jgi:NAD(P)-dependent dehydrogenase (short-subunit alcohol dehydrogenase family)